MEVKSDEKGESSNSKSNNGSEESQSYVMSSDPGQSEKVVVVASVPPADNGDVDVPGLGGACKWTKPTEQDRARDNSNRCAIVLAVVIFSPVLLVIGIIVSPCIIHYYCGNWERKENLELPVYTEEDVQFYLANRGWADSYGPLFAGVDGAAFFAMDDEKLIEIGVSDKEHRQIILTQISIWKEKQAEYIKTFAEEAGQQMKTNVLPAVLQANLKIRKMESKQKIDQVTGQQSMASGINLLVNEELAIWKMYVEKKGNSAFISRGTDKQIQARNKFSKALYFGNLFTHGRLLTGLIDHHTLFKNAFWKSVDNDGHEDAEYKIMHPSEVEVEGLGFDKIMSMTSTNLDLVSDVLNFV